jgi:hypothetical protein
VLHRQLERPSAALVPALTRHRPARVAAPGQAIARRTAQELVARLATAVNEREDRDVIAPELAHPHALRHGHALR